MFAKTVFVVFCATLAVSLAFQASKDDNNVVNTLLGSTTNVIKEVAKVASNDPDKYAVDLNALYKKYGVEERANQAKSYLQAQFKRGIELTNEHIKQSDIKSEEAVKKAIEEIKDEDPVYAEKAKKYYEKLCEYHRVTEDLIKYRLDADKIEDKFISSLRPLEQNLIETIKKFESAIIEGIKKGKGKF